MMRMPWQVVAAVFVAGAAFETVAANIAGRPASLVSLIGDVVAITALLFWGRRNWKKRAAE
jgi:hypothetical protein